jgi:hypothetical protein
MTENCIQEPKTRKWCRIATMCCKICKHFNVFVFKLDISRNTPNKISILRIFKCNILHFTPGTVNIAGVNNSCSVTV